MSLTPGTRLGGYEVVSLLGEGGMGQVYRAKDARLKRDVALKILPEAFTLDGDRIARFHREAQVLASLNHPNIAAIYGFEDSGSTHALILELVEGPTVADRIAKGPIPLDEALPIAKQIAEALEAAHEQGIIHRDLKPANIKVREDGTVKVLDFGLAKAMEPASAISPQLTASPTITTPVQMTGVGMILGTAAYMSPEQARGKPVDSGADIWAFGCLLYEMLTGRRAFLGDDVTECIVTVMTKEPDWTALPAVPPLVGTFLRQSLKKDPKQRLGDMRDMRLALEGVFEVSLPAAAAASSRRIVVLGVAAAAFVVGVVIAGAAFSRVGARVSAPTGVERVSVMTPGNRIVDVPGSPSRSLAISPDGTALVYVTDSRESQPRTLLALRSLATLDVRDLPGTTGALQPFFSPDGQWVAFFTDEGMLKKIALSGGNPITLADKINGSRWAFGVWLDDGTIVFGTTTLALRRVSADSGQMTDLTTLDAARGESSHRLPALVPSTRALLFTAVTDLSAAPRIDAVTLGTGERRVVVQNAWGPLMLGSEFLLFHRQDTTLIARFDARRLALAGPVAAIAEAVRLDSQQNPFPLSELAVSRSGTLAYLPASEAAATLGMVNRDGKLEPLAVPPGPIRYPRIAPDGHRVVYVEGTGTRSKIRLYDLTRGSTTNVGMLDAVFGPAAWRANTDSLAVDGSKGNTRGVFLEGLDGTERLLLPTPKDANRTSNIAWSPDGRQLAYTIQAGALHDVWLLTLEGTPTSAPLLNGPAAEHSAAFSPDGHWLAYVSSESGRSEVYVQPYPRGERLPVSVQGGFSAVWRRDGKELFFAAANDKMMAVSVKPAGVSLQLGKPVPLFDLTVTGPTGERVVYDVGSNTGIGYDILPDGRFVMVRSPDQSTAREIVLVRNWFEELKQRVPSQ